MPLGVRPISTRRRSPQFSNKCPCPRGKIPCPGVWTGERRRGSAPSARLPSGRRELGTWISPHCEPLHVPIPTRRSPDRRSATPHRGGRRGPLLGAVESPHRAITCSDRVMGACFWPHIVAQGQKEWIIQTGMSLLKAEGSQHRALSPAPTLASRHGGGGREKCSWPPPCIRSLTPERLDLAA